MPVNTHTVIGRTLPALLLPSLLLAAQPSPEGGSPAPGTAAPVQAVPASPSAAPSLAEELQKLREQVKALREEASRYREPPSPEGSREGTAGTPPVEAAKPAARQAGASAETPGHTEQEIKQLREQLDALRAETPGTQPGEGAPPAPPTPAQPPTPSAAPAQAPAPQGAGSAAAAPSEQRELEDLQNQVRALQELKQLRDQLGELRNQLQAERDRLAGRVPDTPEQGGQTGAYTRPALSTTPIQDEQGRFRVWINPLKWSLSPYKQNPEAAFELVHHSGDAFVFVIAESVSVPLDTVGKMALKNTQGIAPDARTVLEEKRAVNGVEVLCVQIQGTLEGAIPVTYLGYYFSGPSGTVQVVASAHTATFEKYKPDLFELLNGLEILKRG